MADVDRTIKFPAPDEWITRTSGAVKDTYAGVDSPCGPEKWKTIKAWTPEIFAEEMAWATDGLDTENDHMEADELMCIMLESMGFTEGIEKFRKMTKWYS